MTANDHSPWQSSTHTVGDPRVTSLRSAIIPLNEAALNDPVPAPFAQPAAGGETGAPRAQRGTRLKATTERASLVSSALQRSTPQRLVHHCRPCGTGHPAPNQGSISGV